MNFPPIEFPDFEDTIPNTPIWASTDFHDIRADPSKLRKDQPAMLVIVRSFPRIHTQISLLWGTQELQNRFTRWLLTDQEGRKGWPTDVYQALLTLSNQHAYAFELEGEPNWEEKPDRW